MNLGEKNYQNVVEALTNNAMEATTYASPNPTLSLPQSSSTFPNLSNENDIYRIEESEIYDNSKGDIAHWYNSHTPEWCKRKENTLKI